MQLNVGTKCGDFPSSPVLKTSPSTARGVGSIPGWGAKIPHALQPKKNQNIKKEAILWQIQKILNMAHTKYIFFKKCNVVYGTES